MKQQQHPVLFTLIAVVYMFFNSMLLPEGLLYTTLLAPFMLLLLIRSGGMHLYLPVLFVCLVYAAAHWPSVQFPAAYLKSFILAQATAVFIITAWQAIRKNIDNSNVFKVLGLVNLALLILSLLFLFWPGFSGLVWYKIPISPGIPVVPRLKMFTYEASYYSLIILPVFLYYFLKIWLAGLRPGLIFLSLLFSLLLSFSLGVWACLLLSLVLLFLTHIGTLGKKVQWRYLIPCSIALFLGLGLLYLVYPDNPLYQRIENIFAGKDTSARGRTFEAFTLAVDIAGMKSLTWGIGLGQLKEIGRDYIIQFYQYTNIPATVRIPNAVAETLNIFGVSGLVLRFGLILFLYFKTRVWQNYYRLLLFIFIFIYQFTGSFIFNVAEYILWCLAFSTGILSCFDKKFIHPDPVPEQRDADLTP